MPLDQMPLDQLRSGIPLVAILRGVTPERVSDVGKALFDAGIRAIEVPLNSPDPFASIERLSRDLGDHCLVGAGTVLTAAEVDRTFEAGGRLVVAPNTEPEMIARAVARKMPVMPGVATATEALAAVKAGAVMLKLFPATTYGPGHLTALKDVLPKHVAVYAVGGIGAAHVGAWIAAGAAGFGFGSAFFKPEFTAAEVGRRAEAAVAAVRQALALGKQ